MSTFNSNTLVPTILDPKKRVCYSTGLVLGVDEFLQDQTFFREKDHAHNRVLHGYGTVNGLHVSIREESEVPEILVSPGMAIDPAGRTIDRKSVV